MNTKYELVKTDTKEVNGKTLYRIRALVAIGKTVAAGDLGGHIEAEENLSVSGKAWVHGNARVYGNAHVSGDAQVYGNARVSGAALVSGNANVSGDARVYGNALVFDDARVHGDVWVYGDAWVNGNARVYGNAHVSGDAQVYGNALVFDDARVYGNAHVHGDARVYGNAQVSGDARVSGDALVYGDDCYLLVGPAKSSSQFTTAHKDAALGVRVNCGCFTGTVREFSDAIEETHANNKIALEQYRLFRQLIASNFPGLVGFVDREVAAMRHEQTEQGNETALRPGFDFEETAGPIEIDP